MKNEFIIYEIKIRAALNTRNLSGENPWITQ